MKSQVKFFIGVTAAVLSGGLLATAYPPIEDKFSAWVAFVPLILLAKHSTPRSAWRWGFLSGLVFWLLSLGWLNRLAAVPDAPIPRVALIGVVGVGWILLAAYCALYTACFSLVVARVYRTESRSFLYYVGLLFMIPAVWVGLEYVRSVFLTGFPWNTLGVSQYRNIAIIQHAEWGGVYVISALVMLVNVVFSFTVARFVDMSLRRQKAAEPRFALMMGLLLLLVAMATGRTLAKRTSGANGTTSLRVVAVQPNVPQPEKWTAEFESDIYRRLYEVSEAALHCEPDLIVWPETALPVCLTSHPDTYDFVCALAERGSPILVGSMEKDTSVQRSPVSDQSEFAPGNHARYFNSSYLVLTNGTIGGHYRKQHLVPFGEYVPLDKWITPLQKLVPIGASCTGGETSSVFRLVVDVKTDHGPQATRSTETKNDEPRTTNRENGTVVPFSVLICFEDVMPYLARRAVRGGARLLVNQTNDGWFDGSSASRQHLANGVLRCVENRVPAVRSANTGVTCFIDSRGRIDRSTQALLAANEIDARRTHPGEINIPSVVRPATLYTRFGDWLMGIPCFLVTLIILLSIIRPIALRFFAAFCSIPAKLRLEARGALSHTPRHD